MEPCATLHYAVMSHEVTSPGQPVTLPPGGGLVLDTCWPTDALWFTSQRYLVMARYVSTTRSRPHPAAPASPPTVPAVVLPSGLSPGQLTLTANPWPMGTLAVSGSPSAAWSASQASLSAESDALELLFGLRHALGAGETAWLGSLAPGVAVPAWLDGTPAASLDVTETVSGERVTEVQLSSAVKGPTGTVSFTMTAADTAGAPGAPGASGAPGAPGWRVSGITKGA